MNIVGFNFTKIGGARKRAVVGTVNVQNNILLSEVSEAKIGVGDADRQALRISFSFKSDYTPDMAAIGMDGDVLVLMDKKKADEVIKDFQKDKAMPKEVAQRVMNHILDRCNIQALLLAKDLNLPSPVPLPKVTVQTPKAGQKDAKDDKKSKKSKKE